MPKKDDETIELVARAIAEANEKNRQRERLEIVLLMALFLGGLGFLIAGALADRWELLVPGGFLQFMTAWPLRQIAKLREDKTRLQIVLQLLKLAASKEAKVLAAELVRKLIEQV
jgi:hypothetical protein